jgi:hypothetical protein
MPSTAIRRFEYDPRHRRLDVLFVSGGAYSYFDVPEALALDFRAARSKGRFFQQNIHGHFAFRKDRTGSLPIMQT